MYSVLARDLARSGCRVTNAQALLQECRSTLPIVSLEPSLEKG
jgi:hypothetical protein